MHAVNKRNSDQTASFFLHLSLSNQFNFSIIFHISIIGIILVRVNSCYGVSVF